MASILTSIAISTLALSVAAVPSSSFKAASFVPPAVPSIVSNSPAPTSTVVARRRAVASGYGTNQNFHRSASASTGRANQARIPPALFAKPKRAAAIKKGGKIQVKLLKFVDGTGSPGDVVTVSPAFFENKLKRSKSAIPITDEEVKREEEEKKEEDEEKKSAAEDMKSKIDGLTTTMSRKAGPEGNLFGGVSAKLILQELRSQFPKGALDGKQVKISSVAGPDGVEMNHDIKSLGDYKATVSLLKDITATFTVSVIVEES